MRERSQAWNERTAKPVFATILPPRRGDASQEGGWTQMNRLGRHGDRRGGTRGATRVALFLLTAAFGAASAWMFVHRQEGWAYRIVRQAEAYVPREIPSITGFDPAGEGFVLHASPGADPSWRFDGAIQPPRATTGVQRRRLEKGNDPAAPALAFTTVVHPEARMFSSGAMTLSDAARLPLAEFVATASDYPLEHVAAVRAMLAEAGLAQPAPGEDTESHFARLWLFLYPRLHPQGGAPPPGFEELPAWVQYQRAAAGEAKIRCASYAEILTLFATVAGIATRTVDAGGMRDGVRLGNHTFVEVWYPEHQRFAYSDLNLGTFAIRVGPSGRPLGAIEIATLHRAGLNDALFASIPVDGRLETIPYSELQRLTDVMLSPSATYLFLREYEDRHGIVSKLRRYLLAPEPAVGLDASPLPHRVKQLAFGGFAASGVLWLLATLRRGGGRH